MGSRIESLDVSPKQREIIEWRHQRRNQLRQEYLRESLKPTKQHLLLDDAVTRYGNMRLLHEYRLRVDAKTMAIYCGITFGSIIALAYGIRKKKSADEHKLRTGQVRYADRECKYM